MNPWSPSRKGRVVILSDSMLKRGKFKKRYIKLKAKSGANLRNLHEKLYTGRIREDWNSVGLVVINCGTNDIGDIKEGCIIPMIECICYELRYHNPNIGIIINGILPRPVDFKTTNQILIYLHEEIKKFCDSVPGVYFNPTHLNYLRNHKIRTDQNLYSSSNDYQIHLNRAGIKRLVRLTKQKISDFRKNKL